MGRLRAGVWLAAVVAAAMRCGGSSSPSSPSSSFAPPSSIVPPSTTVPTGAEQWAVSGRVVALGTGRAIAGARISSEVGAATTTASEGTFRLGSDTLPPLAQHRLSIEASQHMPREVYLTWQRGLREQISIDLIPFDAPFSVSFYRQLVRNGFERPEPLEPIRRWTSDPSFYVRTVDQTGVAIEPEIVSLIVATIPRAVSEWTGGRLRAARVETGTDTRTGPAGWIVVNPTRDITATVCGQARVAADPGLITLVLNRCVCGSAKLTGSVVVHEVGHALGFWHVGDRGAVMFSQAAAGCTSGTLSEAERFHAGLAYQRPPGNLDPDRDPRSASFITAGAPAPEVSCFRTTQPGLPSSID